jgi:hypothetical protein
VLGDTDRAVAASQQQIPMIPAAFHCAQVGAGAPRQRRKAYIKLPAITKRIPASISGGQYSTPMRITR